jgi:predicted KAP-like P-loop ATPase
MLNHEKYIKTIDSAINKNFKMLDASIENCTKLNEARHEYLKALRELHSKLDTVERNKEEYQEALDTAEEKMAKIKQDIGGFNCDTYHTIEPLTIGLFGEWGSGKTHLLKGVKNRIITSQEAVKERWETTPHEDIDRIDKLVIPVFFNAWRFEKEEHIIIPLFQTLLSELENYDYIPKLKQIKTKIKILSFALVQNLQMPKGLDIAKVFTGDFSSIEGVGSFFNWKGVSKQFEDEQKKRDKNYLLEQLLTSERIESVYLKIPEWIEKITIFDDVRFVFLVDDLDRCLPENTLKMLESMKLFLDVAGCSFVLAVDDDVVERGVEHHYRDYLHRNNNHIYLNVPTQEVKTEEEEESNNTLISNPHPNLEKRELPITGSEYLEKMVQLPFRIPPIDSVDVKSFLCSKYERFKCKEEKEEQKSLNNERHINVKDETELLNFFAKNIPAKPRKIIRTINLFESKEELMKGLHPNSLLLAKLTLLELFAPKLFRFMQNKRFERIFKLLVNWKEKHRSLSETVNIRQAIQAEKNPKIDEDIYLSILAIIEALYQNRVEFNLDAIFDKAIEETLLTTHITFKALEVNVKETKIFKKVSPLDQQLFLERILSDNELLWEDAFKEDSNLAEAGVLLDDNTFEQLLIELVSKKERIQNPLWLKNISIHLSDSNFKKLLETYNPFEELKNA